jgi:hypothetical protein
MTQRAISATLNRTVAILLPVSFFAALLYEWRSGIDSSRVHVNLASVQSDVTVEITLGDIRYDNTSRAIKGDRELELFGTSAQVEIGEASFTLAPGTDGTIEWIPSSRCRRVDGETVLAANGPTVQSAHLSCGAAPARPSRSAFRVSIGPRSQRTPIRRQYTRF